MLSSAIGLQIQNPSVLCFWVRPSSHQRVLSRGRAIQFFLTTADQDTMHGAFAFRPSYSRGQGHLIISRYTEQPRLVAWLYNAICLYSRNNCFEALKSSNQIFLLRFLASYSNYCRMIRFVRVCL